MNISLPYGRGGVSLKIPDDVHVDFISPREVPALSNLGQSFAETCLAADGFPMEKLHQKDAKILILVADATRDKATSLVLPCCVRFLKDNGASAGGIKIMIARGTHRKLAKEEKQFFKEGELKATIFAQHDCDDAGSMEALLLTTRGTPVRINREVKKADVVILLSPVSFHYFAGFGGCRKLVLPGVADRASITANHRLSLVDSNPVTLNPLCSAGSLEGNPVHEDMCEAVKALDNVFAVNYFSDSSGRVIFMNSGPPLVSHMQACEAYRGIFAVPSRGSYNTVVASAGGYPFDINFLQTHKALRHSARTLKAGGSLLLAAECGEGVGSKDFERALSKQKEIFLKEALSDYHLNNQTAVSIHALSGKYNIGMITSLEGKYLSSTDINKCDNAETFLAGALSGSSSSRVAVIKHAGKTLPVITGEASL